MRSFILLFLIVCFTSQLQAQFMPTANLTIFSEDGNKFFLILNGERQNDVAQTNIRLEELPQPYYNCKIIFEDKTQKEISKNMLMLADANGVMQDVTYKIKKDKNGKQSLRFFSFIPVQQNMVRPSNCAVYRYGNPGVMISGPGFNDQQVNIRGNQGNGSVGIQMNGGGVNMNVRIEDPYANQNINRQQEMSNHYYNNQQQDIQGCFNAYAMNPRDFDDARATLKNEGFDETRLDMAKQIASVNCLNTSQISTICQLFSFEASKLEFAKYAYDHCTDPKNYFKVSNLFSFSSSKTELNNYIQGR
ncbi:MAG: DUF4476 domain-containing protein [Bacteroidetes bacterium]|nr:DUF4476 domain-containing protein [Bacteroidota bacterium]